MSARDAILAAVRQAQATSPMREPEPLAYRRRGDMTLGARTDRFLERLGDYGVAVTTVEHEADIAAAVTERLREGGIARVAVPDDLPQGWLPSGAEVVSERLLDDRSLDTFPASLTACALAIAETGSIVLDSGSAQGRRALTLLPDRHFCVVFAVQLVEIVPEAIQALAPAVGQGRPLTFFSGPSATADIEFDRVVGVHGPRTLDVIFIQS